MQAFRVGSHVVMSFRTTGDGKRQAAPEVIRTVVGVYGERDTNGNPTALLDTGDVVSVGLDKHGRFTAVA